MQREKIWRTKKPHILLCKSSLIEAGCNGMLRQNGGLRVRHFRKFYNPDLPKWQIALANASACGGDGRFDQIERGQQFVDVLREAFGMGVCDGKAVAMP